MSPTLHITPVPPSDCTVWQYCTFHKDNCKIEGLKLSGIQKGQHSLWKYKWNDVVPWFCLIFQANEDVAQFVQIFKSGPEKWVWLTQKLVSFTSGTFRFVSDISSSKLCEIFSEFCVSQVYCLTNSISWRLSVGSVLIFVTRKANSEELAVNLKKNDFEGGLWCCIQLQSQCLTSI